jgi:hypothetical protein
MEAKYRRIGQDGLLSFEYDTARFIEVGGLAGLKGWLNLRKSAFLDGAAAMVARPNPIGLCLDSQDFTTKYSSSPL